MQQFQIDILNKLLNNPGSLTHGEFGVIEGLIDKEIKYIDPTSRFVVKDWSECSTDFDFTIKSLINGVTNPLLDLHALKKRVNEIKVQQRESNQITDFGLNPHNPDNFKPCVGSSLARAMPMTMEQYNYLQGWTQPYDKDPKEKGYLILMIQSTGKNHPIFEHPITWVSEEMFNTNYRFDGNLNYGDALLLLKEGERLMRSGWNGKNMFVELNPGFQTTITINSERHDLTHGDYTVIVNLNNNTMSVWVPSPTDHLATDWAVFKEDF